MLFVSGPRQVGKTTACRAAGASFPEYAYLNWDVPADADAIARGPAAVAERLELARVRDEPLVVVLDEIHRFGRWKTFLKGLFDTWSPDARIVVTGSARLDVFKAGGDSLMGRYFPYRMHPLSVAELLRPTVPESPISPPARLDDDAWQALLRWGGFPEPFLRQDPRFFNRWRRTRDQQLFKEDLRDLTRIAELGQVEVLARMVRARVGQLTSYASLARDVRASIPTISRWLETLARLYWCFAVRPWHRNVTRALRKEPKYYLWDWSQIDDPGTRAENFVASALLRAVHFWTDHGFGEFGLHFVRDKDKNEVDFLVSRDGEAWFLVEIKATAGPLSPALARFQKQTGAPHAFQIALDAEYVDRDVFELEEPRVVPARTLLSQLV